MATTRRDAEALDEIEAVYRSRLLAFVRVVTAIVGDEHLARDVVHDGFVRAVRHRHQLDRRRSPESWIWRIVLNEASKRRAREARVLTVAPRDLESFAAAQRNGDASDVRALISALPERQRLALFLRYFADLGYASIAEALGVRPGTVAATLNAAHRAVRKQLREVER